MYLINTNIEEVLEEFQFVDSWIETVCKNILHKEQEDCKITTFYDYGYFISKSKGPNLDQFDMLFDERLKLELSKVRVNVTIKINNLVLSNRLKKGLMPQIIKSLVTEITKYKMIVECEFHGKEDIKNSIPEFDNSVVSIEIIRQEIPEDKVVDDYFDLDDILDNIAKNGLESLTENEKKFLDKRSKEI